jgi:hypothetical protein
MKTFLLIVILSFCPRLAFAAPVYASSATQFGDTVASVSVSVTPSGSDRLLIGCVQENQGSGNVSAVHFNTTEALTVVVTGVNSGAGEGHLYRRIAPSATTADLQADFVSGGSNGWIGGILFTGAHQTTPLGTPASEGSAGFINSATIDVPSGVDELVFDCSDVGALGALTYGGGQTSRFAVDNGFDQFSGSTKDGAAGNVTMTRGWGGASVKSVSASAARKVIVVE